MFTWKKLGKIFDPTEHAKNPYMHAYSQAPQTLVFEDFVRVYFSTRPEPNKDGMVVSYPWYVDLDRSDLTKVVSIAEKPMLSLGELGMFDEFGIMPFSVTPHGDSYWAYYGGWSRAQPVPFTISIGLATSNDGQTFTRMFSGPVLTRTLHEPFLVGVPKIRRFEDTWYLWYTAGKKWRIVEGRPEAVYKIRMASSNDGVNWIRDERDIIEDALGEHEAQAGADVFFSNGRYHMFFCYRQTHDFRTNRNNTYRIGYAYSDDLVNWKRTHHSGIDVSEDGWDSEMISFPHVFELDEDIYMLYIGNEFGKYGFGLAKLEGKLDI